MIRRTLRVIRKIIIVLLTLAALATGSLWALSYWPRLSPWDYLVWSLNLYGAGGGWVASGKYWGDNHFLAVVMRGKIGVRTTGFIDPVELGEFRGVSLHIAECVIEEKLYDPKIGPNHHTFYRRNLTPEEAARLPTVELQRVLSAPLWIPFTLFASYPTIVLVRGPVLRRWRRRRRRKRGLCVDCGYNLTGNVSGVCPECGTQA